MTDGTGFEILPDDDPILHRSPWRGNLVGAFAALTVVAMIVAGLYSWWERETAPFELSARFNAGTLVDEAETELKNAGFTLQSSVVINFGARAIYERPGSKSVVLHWRFGSEKLHSAELADEPDATEPPGFLEFLRLKLVGWWENWIPKGDAAE
jgi:hypothetical protein